MSKQVIELPEGYIPAGYEFVRRHIHRVPRPEGDRLAFKVDGDDTIIAVGAVMGLRTEARDPHGLTK